MKKSFLLASLVSTLALGAVGCTSAPKTADTQTQDCCSQSDSNPVTKMVSAPAAPETQKSELIKISGIGYGAESTFANYTPGQRRLMAIRASKLDAYRALAEQISGIQIDSNTSVSTLTAKNDSFRARINAVVRGARVVSVTPMADDNYETVLEVYVDKAFFEKAFVYTLEDSAAADAESLYQVRTFQ
ncbi:MAG: LPP20 family lipoprotein [Thiotrichales bacterium]|nr:LPP20 family lipoprotein [Thiotrichales bacterium]